MDNQTSQIAQPVPPVQQPQVSPPTAQVPPPAQIPTQGASSGSKRILWIILNVVLLLLFLGGASYFVLNARKEKTAVVVQPVASATPTIEPTASPTPKTLDPDPWTVAIPAPSGKSAEVQAYFKNEGLPFLNFLKLTVDLPAVNTKEACTKLAEQADTIGSPKDLTTSIGMIEYKKISSIISERGLSYMAAFGKYLYDCDAGNPLEESAKDANFISIILQRLLIQEQVLDKPLSKSR